MPGATNGGEKVTTSRTPPAPVNLITLVGADDLYAFVSRYRDWVSQDRHFEFPELPGIGPAGTSSACGPIKAPRP